MDPKKYETTKPAAT